MSEMTRRQIEQHCLTLRDALGNLFPSIDDPSREYYWELLDELGKAALSALTARSDGESQGASELIAELEKLGIPASDWDGDEGLWPTFAKRIKDYVDEQCHYHEEGLKLDTKNFSEKVLLRRLFEFTFIKRWPTKGLDDEAQELHDQVKSALSPRETDEGYANAHPRELDAPASAPSGEVAEMVKRLRECLSEHNRIRIAFLHNLERSVKPLEYETERQAFEALNNAAALLSKVVQGWVPVSERLPESEKAVLAILETGEDIGVFGRAIEQVAAWHSEHGDYWYARGQQVKQMHKARITYWMPLPPPPERS